MCWWVGGKERQSEEINVIKKIKGNYDENDANYWLP